MQEAGRSATDAKTLSSSEKDYQNHEKRKHLVLRNGFERKNVTFFMEDTFMSIKDFLMFYKKKRLEKYLSTENGVVDVYGSCFKIKNKFKFSNETNPYNAKLILHLVKIKNPYLSVRGLIEKISNNKKNNKETNNSLKVEFEKLKESAMNQTNIEETLNSTVINQIENLINSIKRYENKKGFGKILEDEQYSDPSNDPLNKITTSFEISLKTQLTDSTIFNEEAEIVKTWYKSLGPGSIWEFNLTHHLGKGIHLNHLYDCSFKNKEHPAGYIFVLEQFGDRRGKLRKVETNDIYLGYSPTKITFEFEHKFGYLNEEKFGGDIQTAVYRIKKREEDLLSVIEDLKSGLVINVMYGSGKTLLMEPPHIIVSSNYKLNYENLSKDRWEVYEITTSKELKEIHNSLVEEKK